MMQKTDLTIPSGRSSEGKNSQNYIENEWSEKDLIPWNDMEKAVLKSALYFFLLFWHSFDFVSSLSIKKYIIFQPLFCQLSLTDLIKYFSLLNNNIAQNIYYHELYADDQFS